MDKLNQIAILIGQVVDKSQVNIPKVENPDQKIKPIMNLFLGLMGVISVLMIAIAGFKYTMSMGDPGAIKKAKDTILYAFIGLFVAILGAAIVNFVLGQF